MKVQFKRLVLLAVMTFMSLGSFAATPGVTFLFSDGTKASFAFVDKPVIAVTADGLTVSANGASDVSYAFANVQKFYFEDDIVTAIEQVKNDVSAQRPVFAYVGGVVTVSGLSAGERLAVATINGSQVSAAKADSEGNARVNLSSAPAGVYVVSTGSGVSFKLLKK